MSKVFFLAASLLTTQLFAQVDLVDSSINEGETVVLSADNEYLLDGFVFVETGATLIIEPGTVIKAKAAPTTGDFSSALIIARGGKIIADGTAEQPIIFTSENDDLNDPNDLTWEDRGEWGGLILLGNATTNRGIEGSIEGIPTGEARATYGGDDDHDNSGILRYVSVRHGGGELGPGDEINGVTFGAVGDRTVVDYVEVFANDDDGFEWFGGTVNTSHLVAAFCKDDSFDYDEGWRGKNQFWFTIIGTDKGGAPGEHDGGTVQETAPPFATPYVANATYIGPGASAVIEGDRSEAIIFRDNAGGKYLNSIITEYNGANGGKAVTVEDIDGADSRERLEAGDLLLSNNLWWNFGVGNNIEEAVTQDFLRDHLAANHNQFANPQLRSLDWGKNNALDPRPAANGPAASGAAYMSDSFFQNVDYIGAFAPNAALWTDNWTAVYHENHTVQATVPARMISHVTRANGGFTSTMYLNNPGTNNAKVVLGGYLADGTHSSDVTLTVPGNTTWSEDLATTFGGAEISHIGITASNAVSASVGYKIAAGSGATAHVKESAATTKVFSFVPAEQDLVFDGLAIVNAGSAAADITAHMFASDGSELGTLNIATGLASMAKQLATFDGQNLDGVALIRVVSTQPMAATVLRGTRVGVEPGYLYQTVPLP